MMHARRWAGPGLVLAGATALMVLDTWHQAREGQRLEWTSGAIGRLRDVDHLAGGCEPANPRAAQLPAVLDALAHDATPELAALVAQARGCLPLPACTACMAPLVQRMEAIHLGALGEVLALERTQSQDHILHRWAALWLWALALMALWWRAATAATAAAPAVPAPAPPPRDEHGLEDVLRARLEDLYAKRLQAAASNRLAYFGEVAAGLSHGLKTPLAGIRAAAHVAHARLPQDHAAQSNLQDIMDAVDGLTAQVNQMLATARSDGPVLAPTRVEQLWTAPGPVADSLARARGRGIDVVLPGDAPRVVLQADAGLLQLALANLLDNAVQCSPAGGAVTVCARATAAPPRAGLEDLPAVGSTWMEVAVLDDGPGVPGLLRAGGTPQSTTPQGSALGVAITRRIVQRHGGALVFTPRQPHGTSAAMVLPVQDGAP